MIRIRGLLFEYPKEGYRLALPALDVASGERVAVIGRSGTGKTTLLLLIAGILQPARGQIDVDRIRISDLDENQRRAFRISHVGFVFQSLELLDYLTVEDNLLHTHRLHPNLGLTREVRQRAKDLAESLGLSTKLRVRPGRLSQGERQRVAVCRALLSRPSLLLADEATGNLDPWNKQRVVDFLLEASAKTGSTLVVVTHDHEILDRFDRVIDLDGFKEPN